VGIGNFASVAVAATVVVANVLSVPISTLKLLPEISVPEKSHNSICVGSSTRRFVIGVGAVVLNEVVFGVENSPSKLYEYT
jgi:hypothetical protein